MKTMLRVGYVPFMLIGLDGSAVYFASHGRSEWFLLTVILAAVIVSFLAERALPYQDAWNEPRQDNLRDALHAFVNESLILLSVAVIPLMVAFTPDLDWWPSEAPFLVQVFLAIVAADLGITLVHLASHKIGWLWRFHAVHHSVTRCYGLNGLMKHPLHQTLEMAGGVLPLILLGLPQGVGAALAVCVAVQLLLQHSNVDYRVGALRRVLALNEGHRFHHLKWAGIGDVNFGLFTLLWDHLLGTYSYDPRRVFTSADLGMAAKPDYPSAYVAQLVEPFKASGACGFEQDPS